MRAGLGREIEHHAIYPVFGNIELSVLPTSKRTGKAARFADLHFVSAHTF